MVLQFLSRLGPAQAEIRYAGALPLNMTAYAAFLRNLEISSVWCTAAAGHLLP
jgi:hypothetical protein